jgi:signal peptidase II
MKKKLIRILLLILFLSIHIGCDQSTKKIAEKYLKGQTTVFLLSNFFILTYAENNGAFLSIFSDFPKTARKIILILLPSIALIGLLGYIYIQINQSLLYLFALTCIAGGGISNVMIDRAFNNEYVVDFMNMGIGNLRTGIFNMADLSIMLGGALILYLIFIKKDPAFHN